MGMAPRLHSETARSARPPRGKFFLVPEAPHMCSNFARSDAKIWRVVEHIQPHLVVVAPSFPGPKQFSWCRNAPHFCLISAGSDAKSAVLSTTYTPLGTPRLRTLVLREIRLECSVSSTSGRPRSGSRGRGLRHHSKPANERHLFGTGGVRWSRTLEHGRATPRTRASSRPRGRGWRGRRAPMRGAAFTARTSHDESGGRG